MVSKLEHALRLAAQGFYLFPLGENSKVPEAGYNWKHRSTCDPEIIKRWFMCPVMGWPRNPNIAIDCGKSGLYVIDVDVKKGKQGDKTLAALKKKGLTPTLESLTPSGGRHLIYKNNANLTNTAEALGEGIDTRGIGGYIVAPGSEIDGVRQVSAQDSHTSKDKAIKLETMNQLLKYAEDTLAKVEDWQAQQNPQRPPAA